MKSTHQRKSHLDKHSKEVEAFHEPGETVYNHLCYSVVLKFLKYVMEDSEIMLCILYCVC